MSMRRSGAQSYHPSLDARALGFVSVVASEPKEHAMRLMKWTAAMSVGLPELDADHRVLIKIINELAINSENPARTKVLRQCLYELWFFTQNRGMHP